MVLVESIRYHHNFSLVKDSNGKVSQLPVIVGFANLMMHMFVDENAFEAFANHQVLIEQVLGITDAMIPGLITELKLKVQQANSAAMAIY